MPSAALDVLLQALLVVYPFRRGRKKLVRFAATKLSGAVVWETGDGTRLLLDVKNYIDREVVTKGGFEAPLIAFFLKRTAGYDVFLDIGANIGLYSVAAARHTAMAVIAFEPDPRNYGQMEGNLFLNGLETRVVLRKEAAGPKREQIVLHASRDPDNFCTGLSSISRAGKGTIAIPIQAVSLDDEFPEWTGRRIAIKMDIEGFELHALAGMGALLKRNHVFLQIEITENLEAVRARLAELGMAELPQLYLGTADYYFETAV